MESGRALLGIHRDLKGSTFFKITAPCSSCCCSSCRMGTLLCCLTEQALMGTRQCPGTWVEVQFWWGLALTWTPCLMDCHQKSFKTLGILWASCQSRSSILTKSRHYCVQIYPLYPDIQTSLGETEIATELWNTLVLVHFKAPADSTHPQWA